MTIFYFLQGSIEGEELVVIEVYVDQFFAGGIIYQAAIGAHTSVLVEGREVLFESNVVGSGIDFQELLIRNFSVQFAENELIVSDGVCFGEATGR